MQREAARGYTYEGRSQFVPTRGRGLPKLKLAEQLAGLRRPTNAEYNTVLIHRDGSTFTKR